jgi:hypothetical protein
MLKRALHSWENWSTTRVKNDRSMVLNIYSTIDAKPANIYMTAFRSANAVAVVDSIRPHHGGFR